MQYNKSITLLEMIKIRIDLIEKLEGSSKSDLVDICRVLDIHNKDRRKKKFVRYDKWNRQSYVDHIVRLHDTHEELLNQFLDDQSILADHLKEKFVIKCTSAKCRVQSIVDRYRHDPNHQEKNLLQIALISDSRLEAVEWVEIYALAFAKLYEEGEHDLHEIEKRLYKE